MSKYQTFELVNHTACESMYRHVDTGEVIRLWAIVGGTLAVAFDNFEFTERLNYCEQFDSSKDAGWPTWEGPRLENVDGGETRIRAWFEKSVELRIIRRERYACIREAVKARSEYHIRLKSRRFHDLDNRTYVWFELDLNSARVSPVTCSSKYYAGRCEGTIEKWGNQAWRTLAEFFNPLFDNGMPMWEDLTAEVFEQVLAVLRASEVTA